MQHGLSEGIVYQIRQYFHRPLKLAIRAAIAEAAAFWGWRVDHNIGDDAHTLDGTALGGEETRGG